MEEIKKRKRGRPKKIKLPEEVQSIIDATKEVQAKEEQEFIQDIEKDIVRTNFEWDYPISQTISFFDRSQSYEICGYKPIDKTHGLDFDPSWFTEARDNFEKTGHYCQYQFGSKLYRDFWNQEYKRCIHGMTVNGYTITGCNYFFLNYYQLKNSRVEKAGTARKNIFPRFMVCQYEFFHYLELCKLLRRNICMMKSRAVGFSEILASICANEYSCYRDSITMITAYDSGKLEKTLEKVWGALTFLNDKTDGGFFKLRQVVDKADIKRASFYKVVNGQKVEDGWKSQIEGIVADKPSKVRGDRAELVMFEEAGSNPTLLKSFIQGEALVDVGGNKMGILVAGGTGGDSGAALDGLKTIYYDPESYLVLPYRHSCTDDGSQVFTGFFIPSYSALDLPDMVDYRGVVDIEKAKEHYQKHRDRYKDPKALVTYCAEYCFTAEEAFALEGDNKFNKVLLADQLAQIRLHKQGPKIQHGEFKFIFKTNNGRKQDMCNNVTDVQFIPTNTGEVHIIQQPLWLLQSEDDEGNKISYKEMKNLYVAGIDSIDIGQDQTSDATKSPSKFCITIKKRAFGNQEPMYVAYYLARPDDVRVAYKTAMQMLMYYNCQANIEATRVSMLTWARDRGFYKYFINRPRATYPDPNKIPRVRQVGSPATNTIISHQTDLIADFVEDYSHTIWFTEMLDQLIAYNDANKTKFDCIAAMGMTELADEELSGVVPREIEEINEEWQDIGWYKDEKGYKHFGVIPKQINTYANIKVRNDYRARTSDPRNRW